MKQLSPAMAVLVLACAPAASARGGDHLIAGKTETELFPDASLADLARSACSGDEVGIRAAIAHRVDPNGRGTDGITPLIWTEGCRNYEGFVALLESGADPNLAMAGPGGLNPVGAAARMENPAFLRAILQHGGDPNATEQDSNWTALRHAFTFGFHGGGWINYETLLEAGADINRGGEGETITMFAANMGRYDKVADLLRRGYHANLALLAYHCQQDTQPVTGPEQQRWRLTVIEMLRQRGIVFPVTREAAGLPPLP